MSSQELMDDLLRRELRLLRPLQEEDDELELLADDREDLFEDLLEDLLDERLEDLLDDLDVDLLDDLLDDFSVEELDTSLDSDSASESDERVEAVLLDGLDEDLDFEDDRLDEFRECEVCVCCEPTLTVRRSVGYS